MKAVTLVSTLLFFLFGCSNDSVFEGVSDNDSRKAMIEEAALALDDREYASVISLLSEFYNSSTSPDPRVCRLLSSAYMGMAGVDFVEFIEYAGRTERESFDAVADSLVLFAAPEHDLDEESLCNTVTGEVLVSLDDEDNTYEGALAIDGNCADDVISCLENAQRPLSYLIAASLDTNDDRIQLGLASAAHFVMFTGRKVSDALLIPDADAEYPPAIPVPVNSRAYQYFYQERYYTYYQYPWSALEPGDFAVETAGTGSLNTYQEDLVDVLEAVRAFDLATTGPNDVRDALEDFLAFALLMPTTGIDEAAIVSTMTTSGLYELVNSFSVE